MSALPPSVVPVRLCLLDVWGGEDVIREMTLAELETSERGIAVGSAFYPWRRVISYEWEIVESSPDEALARPRQLMVRVLIQGAAGPEERRVGADHFEVGPWTISMVVPERVEPDTQRTVMRRVTVPWHRVLEYERMLAEAKTASEVPSRPDLGDARRLPEGGEIVEADGHVVIDVAAVERSDDALEPEETPAGSRPVATEQSEDAINGSTADAADGSTADAINGSTADAINGSTADAADGSAAEEEPVAVGTGARVKSSVPNKTGQRRRRPRRG